MFASRFDFVFFFALFIAVPGSFAASFTVASGATDNSAKTLGSGSGQSGTVNATGKLSVSGSTVAITITGTNATITNGGTIEQTGTGRTIRDNTGGLTLTVTNNAGGLIQAAGNDVFQMNVAGSTVTLNNSGTIKSVASSAQAINWNALNTNTGTNTLRNFATGIVQAGNADAIRPGRNGVITNDGKIQGLATTNTGSDGIAVMELSGISITNADLNLASNFNLIEGASHGISGGQDKDDNIFNVTFSVTNKSNGTIRGNDGSGINVDGTGASEVVTVNNSGLITGNGITGDGDGVDVDGLVTLTNSGTIRSINSFGTASEIASSEGITTGGGTIVNSGTIEGAVAAGNNFAIGRGVTLAGVDTSGTPLPIYAISAVTNSGTIRGQNDSGIVVLGAASGFTVTITNQAGGIIRGGGATAAAIQTGADNDTVNNAGQIVADSSGKAIDLGAGNDTLNITTGNAASITGSVSGGTGTNSMNSDPGAGNGFTYAGTIANFSSVTIKSGTTALSGTNTYTGTTTITGGTLAVGANAPSGGSGVLGNATTAVLLGDTAAGVSGNAALLTSGAFTVGRGITVQAAGSGATQTASIGGNQSTGNSTFSGAIGLNRDVILTAASGGQVTFTGAISNATGTRTATVGGGGVVKLQAGSTNPFAPTRINVTSGGTLLLGASEQIGNATAMTLSGGKLQTAGFDETLGALILSSASIIDLGSGDTILRFADSHTLSASWTGTLDVHNWSGSPTGGGTDELFFGTASTGLTPGQLSQIRFFSGSGTGFLGPAGILGSGELVPVPEPATIWGGLSLLGLAAYRERRRWLSIRIN